MGRSPFFCGNIIFNTTNYCCAPLYRDGISVTQTGTVKAGIFKDQLPAEKVQELEIDMHKAIGKKATYNWNCNLKVETFLNNP